MYFITSYQGGGTRWSNSNTLSSNCKYGKHTFYTGGVSRCNFLLVFFNEHTQEPTVPSKNRRVRRVSGQPPQPPASMIGPYSPQSISLYGRGDGTYYTKEKRCQEAERKYLLTPLAQSIMLMTFVTFQRVMTSLERRYVVYRTILQ